MLEAAKDFKPDLFIWAGYAQDALPLLEQSKAMRFSPPVYLGAPPAWPVDFGKSPLAENVMLYGMWAPSINAISPVSRKFYDSYVKPTAGRRPATSPASRLQRRLHRRGGVKRAGGVDKAKLIAALEATKYCLAPR